MIKITLNSDFKVSKGAIWTRLWAATWQNQQICVCPATTQISLGIRPVWSESSLSAWRNLGSLATHWAHGKDSDQTGRMPRLIWVFAGRTAILLVLSCRGWIIKTIVEVALSYALSCDYHVPVKLLISKKQIKWVFDDYKFRIIFQFAIKIYTYWYVESIH